MLRKSSVLVFALLVLSIALAACSPAATPAAPAAPQVITSVVTQIVAGTPETITQVITATPELKPTTLAAGSVTLTGSGATFPQPLYAEWTYAYQYVDPSVLINYQGGGSGKGKTDILAGTVDFAGSDSLLSADQYTQGKDLQMYPIVAGAVVPIYNLQYNLPKVGAKTPTPAPIAIKLVLDRQTLVDIFNGKVTMWNDAEIVKLNPDLKDVLPAKKIVTVHRSDGSGTTEIFTKSLTAFSPDWKAGGAQTVQWPTDKSGGISGKGNPGVAAAVIATPNSIGYVELNYAIANSIPFTDMINKAGKKVTANGASLNAAMADFAGKFDAKLNNTIVDAPGAGSWPMSAYTYIILHTNSMTDCTKASKLLQYITWSLNDPLAASKAKALGYSTLTDADKKLVMDKLAEVTCNGNPVVAK